MSNNRDNLWRYIFIGAFFIVICIVYVALFINLQVSGQDYYSMAKPVSYKARTVKIQAHRGEIFDRNGKSLVENEYSNDLRLDYGSMPSKTSEKNDVIMSLTNIFKTLGQEELLNLPKYNPFIITVDGESLNFEFNEEFFETTKASKYKKLSSELSIKEDSTAKDAAEVFMLRYGLTDKEGRMQYLPETAAYIFSYRMELDLTDFSTTNPYTFASDVPMETIAIIEEAGIKGNSVFENVSRIYNYPGYASHILGRIGKIPSGSEDYYTDLGYPLNAVVGISGAEAAFEKYLHGVDGEITITEDQYGNVIEAEVTKEPVAGSDVYLTIDIEMQMKAEDALASTIDLVRERGKSSGKPLNGEDSKAGALTVLNPKTGEVIVLASYPTYNLATYSEDYKYLSEDETSPLLNRTLSGTYQPGSTFKPGVAVAALDAGIITEYSTINDKGVYDYYTDYKPQCWIHLMFGQTHGYVNVTEAIQESCNYFFYEVGRLLTIENLTEYMKSFGLGDATGIELKEEKGILAGPDYRNDNGIEAWTPGDTLQAAIGQSDNLFTPLQMGVYISTILNNGTRYGAHLLSKVCSFDGQSVIYNQEPEIIDSIELKDGVCSVVINAMKNVIEEGSASEVFADFPITVGGKTGTAQVSKVKSDNAIFTAFAPFDDPEIVATCVIEQGSTGSNAGIAVRELFDYCFSVGDYASDDGNDE